MRELFTTLFVFAAAFMLWRAIRPHHDGGDLRVVHADPRGGQPGTADTPFKWPTQGKFDFPVVESASHQAALRRIADASSAGDNQTPCVATLHMGGSQPHVYKPVEVRVFGERVAFLSSGDASRFQRRLAYEGRAGQTTCCDAVVVETSSGGRPVYDIRLDLKEFRH